MTPDAIDAALAALLPRLAEVREAIGDAARRSGRRPEEVTLVAVTKTHPPEMLAAALAAGVTDIGENYLQEADTKFTALGWPAAGNSGNPVRRHAIGHIQGNKAALAVRWCEVVQTVDSLRLAERLDRLAREAGRILPVLLEVNISHESRKSGIIPAEVAGMLPTLANLTAIRVMGLMTIGRYQPDPESARGDFAALRALRDRLQQEAPSGIVLQELSMGMSHDYVAAIEEGATIVRVGSRLFGPRPTTG
jgi:PLP dependent protein